MKVSTWGSLTVDGEQHPAMYAGEADAYGNGVYYYAVSDGGPFVQWRRYVGAPAAAFQSGGVEAEPPIEAIAPTVAAPTVAGIPAHELAVLIREVMRQEGASGSGPLAQPPVVPVSMTPSSQAAAPGVVASPAPVERPIELSTPPSPTGVDSSSTALDAGMGASPREVLPASTPVERSAEGTGMAMQTESAPNETARLDLGR